MANSDFVIATVESSKTQRHKGSDNGQSLPPINAKLKFQYGDYDVADDTHLADNDHGFFTSGREYENAFVNHKYTEKERKELLKYDSLDYLPPWSTVYKNWVSKQPRKRLEWDRWVMMGLIGFTVGVVGFLLHQIIDMISDTKWTYSSIYLKQGLALAWIFALGYSLIFLIPATALVVWYRPSAAGSGIPELMGFMNGTVIRHIFNIRTMLVKFLSCAFAVGAGMPVGPEGPMMHLGGLIGAGLSQFKSDSLGLHSSYFQRFRNSEDRRNFISAGVAAGVSSSIGAPVGGLLFSMEEMSSFWNMKLSWQTFFCCMISTFTTDLFNSAFRGFSYTGNFGLFSAEANITVQVDSNLPSNILAFIPAVTLGILGGTLGALFTFFNIKIAHFRRKLLSKIEKVNVRNVLRMTEPCIIMIITTTVTVLLPAAFNCTDFECNVNRNITNQSLHCNIIAMAEDRPPRTESNVGLYTCPEGVVEKVGDFTSNNKTYNEVATLIFVTGEQTMRHLFSNGTHYQFSIPSLLVVLAFYYFLACWAAGTSISSGMVGPMLLIGGLYGRVIGQAMVWWFGLHIPEDDDYWSWIDPGAMAVIGAASFFGGVSRLTMSLTVMMFLHIILQQAKLICAKDHIQGHYNAASVEMTKDMTLLLPIMTAIMVSKWVGDFFTHSLYHSLLEFKCIPFLDAEPVVYDKEKQPLNMELHCVGDVMTSPVITLSSFEKVTHLSDLLLTTTHGGFPILKENGTRKVMNGFITRLELCTLLQHENTFVHSSTEVQGSEANPLHPDYSEVHIDRLVQSWKVYDNIRSYLGNKNYSDKYIDLSPYVNKSCVTLPQTFSLHRTYIIFRTLGLRHLPVVDENNCVVGIITRKDLMGFKLEEKLHRQTRKSRV